MPVDIILGLQWGDEGKGKIVDLLSAHYDLVARFQGGPNAGHTLEFSGKKFVLNTIPSGVFANGTMNLIGSGVVIDVIALKNEILRLKDAGYDLLEKGNLMISKRAHLILPTHRLLDEASENQMGEGKIGTTRKGIGPAYTDKFGRAGLRMGDINEPDFKQKYFSLVAKHETVLKQLYNVEVSVTEEEEVFFDAIAFLADFPLVDSELLVNDYLIQGKKVLAEGAQGTLLDVDFGSYPYVTSSTTTAAGACVGLGIAPGKVGEVIGIFKAYCTRVGAGPFPTELHDETGELLRKTGNEFGAVSGRPRRTGWLDLPALKQAILLNGVTQLIMTKADVLSELETIYVCTRYREGDIERAHMPYALHRQELQPVLKAMNGWKEDIRNTSFRNEIPEALQAYIRFIETEAGVPVTLLSVGPNRRQTIRYHITD
ncbi:adenylosuccinate synthase [Dyadobacter luteus]|uniref:Adenylosuccinate synthetase n=1 Tax=Dyadobacter luteus TaxID=2259619 RepID=A0A3D8Y3B9_9BACT|nr:adenylosuccinate synthase [Dyadobacter luteus]REA56139.1 adenylosuccinate synthase [Dyadobacter luteus]